MTYSDTALKVLQERYLRKNNKGELVETPDELFKRVAKAVAAAEITWGGEAERIKWERRFYEVMSELLFLPNSPTLMNAGTPMNQLSACFVLPVEDSLEGIFNTLKLTALIQHSGGGTGFNFSELRPANDLITSTGGLASGPVSFMKIFDAATQYIRQGGKRRGANMGVMNIDHPDIESFITSKGEEGVLSNFNISVAVPDAFMNALHAGADWSLIHPLTKQTVRSVPARYLWNLIIQNAWGHGDPGLIFTDTINATNPLPQLGYIDCTNPCGEVPLLPYEACNLGSINLSRFTINEKGKQEIDWEQLGAIIPVAIRFLDNVIEENNYLTDDIRYMAYSNRKIGLGVMGWADLLILLGIPYNTSEAVLLAEKLVQFIKDRSIAASADLARQRGTFGNWKQSIYYPYQPLRNATRLSIAPTGTISIIANTSSSIEPLFAIAYSRQHVLNDEDLFFINPFFIDYCKKNHLYTTSMIDQIRQEGSVQQVAGLPDPVKDLYKTATEIEPEWHLRHQAAFQRQVDNAVAKTINLPESARMEDVDHIYHMAWSIAVKGITIFRSHSKQKQVLYNGIHTSVDACKVCIE